MKLVALEKIKSYFSSTIYANKYDEVEILDDLNGIYILYNDKTKQKFFCKNDKIGYVDELIIANYKEEKIKPNFNVANYKTSGKTKDKDSQLELFT